MSISRTTSNGRIKLSLGQFIDKSNELRGDVEQNIPLLLRACCIFNEEQVVASYGCTFIIETLHTIQQPLHASYTLLEKTARLPRAVIPLRYQLLALLYPFERLICELECRISAFHLQSCTASLSNESSSQRQLISSQFDALAQGCQDVVKEICVLLDQIRFQEKQFKDIECVQHFVHSEQARTRSLHRIHQIREMSSSL